MVVSSQELAADPLGILRPSSKLQHTLPLASAYSALKDAAIQRPGDQAVMRQRRRIDDQHLEPKCAVLCVEHEVKQPSIPLVLSASIGSTLHLGRQLPGCPHIEMGYTPCAALNYDEYSLPLLY